MIDYTEIKITPTTRVSIAFKKVAKYFLPDCSDRTIRLVCNAIRKDKLYRRAILNIIMQAVDNGFEGNPGIYKRNR